MSEINKCLDIEKSFPKNLPISFDMTKQNGHIDILVKNQNQFDHYKVNWKGLSCHRELGADQKPNKTVDDIQCDGYERTST